MRNPRSPRSGQSSISSDLKTMSDDEQETNPFFDMAEAESLLEENKKSKPVVKRRDWGIPTFEEQCNGLNTFKMQRMDDPSTFITINLEHRRHSTGSDVWDAALVLAYALDRPGVLVPEGEEAKVLEGKTVLELGSGTGALGLYCAHCLGAKHVILTDLEPNLDLIRRNAAINAQRSQSSVSISALDWTQQDFSLELQTLLETYGCDLIVGSDLFLPFASDLLRPLARTIQKLLSFVPQALICYEERFDCTAFFEFISELHVEKLSPHLLHPSYQDPDRIFVLRLRRR